MGPTKTGALSLAPNLFISSSVSALWLAGFTNGFGKEFELNECQSQYENRSGFDSTFIEHKEKQSLMSGTDQSLKNTPMYSFRT